ncbi:fimbria/pilus periplasmic chaperone [Burkholderia contaminans]|uniref:fimbrial biogenesis chaperone n=1 Tax=Burkholderia TaxID=32008 RepID=UPI000B7A8188|nr:MULTISPECIES: fimbria/pilus periplasmic chaperone [Burkholderia]MCI3970424.1 fimbria/pilus periplasmic chaperone [Burkholderia sp. HI4860]MDN7790910.1 fimbria/pilus periplasmic chaperone [Burkholderia contaminans]OXJ04799.1 molecular chaperone [Burkholderia sp. AU33647]
MTFSIRIPYLRVVAGVVAWTACATLAQAALLLNGTRVIFPEHARDVTIRMENSGTQPVLAQSWIDDGRADVPPEQMRTPFVVAPTLVRVEAGRGAVLRITNMQESLPTDRESVFWLNVLEVPAVQQDAENQLRFAFRTRIKLFYRPSILVNDVDTAQDQLAWKVPAEATHAGQRQVALEVSNPTPYYVSFGTVEGEVGGNFISAGGGMVAPFGTQRFPLPGVAQSHRPTSVRYVTIDDYGGRTTITRKLID